MKTSEIAAQAQVNTQTLRYYERRGLLPEPERTRAGYRAYTPDAVRVVRFVKRAQQLRFTLDDIEDLLNQADGGPASCDDARTMARTRIADLQQRINELVGRRDALTQLVDTCDQPSLCSPSSGMSPSGRLGIRSGSNSALGGSKDRALTSDGIVRIRSRGTTTPTDCGKSPDGKRI